MTVTQPPSAERDGARAATLVVPDDEEDVEDELEEEELVPVPVPEPLPDPLPPPATVLTVVVSCTAMLPAPLVMLT